MFALLLLALAGFTLLVVRRFGVEASEEALAFAYIGAAGITLVAVAVVLLGLLSGTPGRAEGLALLGLAAFVIYVLAAWAVTRFVRTRS